MKFPIQKVIQSGNKKVMITERGTLFGPDNLVVDFKNILKLKEYGIPVIMDCTHAAQIPVAGGKSTSGNRELVPYLASAAKVFGVDGYFLKHTQILQLH